jgi:GTP cyclohydrolase I
MNENFNIETIAVTEQIKMNYEEILNLVGEDKTREGFIKNP